MIEQAIEIIDQLPHPDRWMANCAQHLIRITEEGLEQQGDKRDRHCVRYPLVRYQREGAAGARRRSRSGTEFVSGRPRTFRRSLDRDQSVCLSLAAASIRYFRAAPRAGGARSIGRVRGESLWCPL